MDLLRDFLKISLIIPSSVRELETKAAIVALVFLLRLGNLLSMLDRQVFCLLCFDEARVVALVDRLIAKTSAAPVKQQAVIECRQR